VSGRDAAESYQDSGEKDSRNHVFRGNMAIWERTNTETMRSATPEIVATVKYSRKAPSKVADWTKIMGDVEPSVLAGSGRLL
jgi:hypothetical protein